MFSFDLLIYQLHLEPVCVCLWKGLGTRGLEGRVGGSLIIIIIIIIISYH